jgi:hypothetical protein
VRVRREGGRVFVRWPGYLTGYTLESTENLTAGEWQPVTEPVLEVTGENESEVAQPIPRARFFRLRKPVESALNPAARVSGKTITSTAAPLAAPKPQFRKRRYLLAPDGTIRPSKRTLRKQRRCGFRGRWKDRQHGGRPFVRERATVPSAERWQGCCRPAGASTAVRTRVAAARA